MSYVCANTGWTWDYVLEHVDIPRFEALSGYWVDHPPLQWMVSAYFNLGKKSPVKNIEEASEFVPVETVPQAEFDALLSGLGIPAAQQ